MAASSASTVCLEATEVLGWFKEAAQKREVFARFAKAQITTGTHPGAYARDIWAATCKNMQAVVDEPVLAALAFDMVCDILEQYSKALEHISGSGSS